MTQMEIVISLLQKIVSNQETAPKFSKAVIITTILASAVGYVIALATNNAFVTSFKAIPIGQDGIAGSWIYFAFILPIGIVLIILFLLYLQPFLRKKID